MDITFVFMAQKYKILRTQHQHFANCTDRIYAALVAAGIFETYSSFGKFSSSHMGKDKKNTYIHIYIYAMFQGTRSGLHELVKSIRFHWIISKLENNILVTGSFLSPLKHYVFQYNIIRLHNDTNSLIYYIRFSKLTMLTSV